MALADLVQTVVNGVLSTTVDSFKANVTYRAWVGDTGDGEDQYAAPVVLRPIVNRKKKIRFTSGGAVVTVIATLTFTDPVAETAANVGKTREQPIDPRDKFTLDDGTSAPVLSSTGGTINPSTGHPFAMRVELGTVERGA